MPNRSWYKHQIYAPGFYTGYGVKTLPAVREAVDSKDWASAQKETEVVEQCLTEMNQVVTDAINGLSGFSTALVSANREAWDFLTAASCSSTVRTRAIRGPL